MGLNLERQRRAKTTRKEVPPPFSELSMPSTHVRSSPPLQAKWMAGRVITMGRWINFAFFNENGFVFGEWIRRQG